MSTLEEVEVVIVGAGLSGLCLAYELTKRNVDFRLVEATSEIGGRIKTIRPKGPNSHIELGATWFGHSHFNLKNLLVELGIPIFEQSQNGKALFQSMSFVEPQIFDVPQGQEPTYRIVNGTSSILDSLVTKLERSRIVVNYAVKQIVFINGEYHLTATKNNQNICAKKVILTIPPQLAAGQMLLPDQIGKEALGLMKNTHTWMHDSVKFALISSTNLWREMGFSGTFFSQVGPVVEMYDHSNNSQDFFSLKGFLSGAMHVFNKAEREQKVRTQLKAVLPYYEDKLFDYIDYNWAENDFVHLKEASALYPHQNNGHAKLRASLIENSFWLGGTETAKTHPGYMDGAVERAKELANSV